MYKNRDGDFSADGRPFQHLGPETANYMWTVIDKLKVRPT